MRPSLTFFLLFIFPALMLSNRADAGEWSGYAAIEGRFFPNDPAFSGQRDQSGSLSAQPEFYQDWESGGSVTFVPFFRIDSADSGRSHFDLREFFYLQVFEDFEWSVGIRKVFWGVTESQHLVDIINQTDLVELPDGEEKLGQPMLNLSLPTDWGTFDLFLLPYFRERTFPAHRGRLRSHPVVETKRAQFESGAEKNHLDLAIRYSHILGDWDVGLSHFRGTGRVPTFLPAQTSDGTTILIPLYEQIDQTGLDVSWVENEWLWKLEAIRRTGQGESFFATTTGFEYIISGISETRSDLGLIVEWLYNEAGDQATSPFQNDLMAGFRVALNDIASTAFLFGVIMDLESDALLLTLESASRIGEALKMEVEVFLFEKVEEGALLKSFEEDGFIQVTLAYYF